MTLSAVDFNTRRGSGLPHRFRAMVSRLRRLTTYPGASNLQHRHLSKHSLADTMAAAEHTELCLGATAQRPPLQSFAGSGDCGEPSTSSTSGMQFSTRMLRPVSHMYPAARLFTAMTGHVTAPVATGSSRAYALHATTYMSSLSTHVSLHALISRRRLHIGGDMQCCQGSKRRLETPWAAGQAPARSRR